MNLKYKCFCFSDEEEEEEEEKYEDTTDDENGDNDEEGVILSDMGEDDENEDGKIKKQPNGLVDMEDLGKVINGMKTKRTKKNAVNGDAQPKEMITPLLRKSLEKQGYKLIGTHSGVKLCRWTKSMLRGRGGCYKHTFYGIESHRCMETTPSLACGII